jgi:hypothetical protein
MITGISAKPGFFRISSGTISPVTPVFQSSSTRSTRSRCMHANASSPLHALDMRKVPPACNIRLTKSTSAGSSSTTSTDRTGRPSPSIASNNRARVMGLIRKSRIPRVWASGNCPTS